VSGVRCSRHVAALYHLGMVKLTRLKDVRRRKALTQQQLADRAGVNRVTIARIEGGKDEPFPTTVRKVADALGVDPEELLEPVAASVANGPFTAPVNGAAADLSLDARITVVDEENVERLLRSTPDLAPLVNEAAEQLSRYFPDARLQLRHMFEPEGDEEELILGALTNQEVDTDPDVDEAMAALDRFDQDWWLLNMRRANGLLIVTLG
jgi:transcriptional regulator with XRE-family HTH domain